MSLRYINLLLPLTKEEVHVFADVCLSVYLSVSKITKNACMDLDEMMKCCMSTDVRTWTNILTFEPSPDRSLDVGTGLLSAISYMLRIFAALSRLPAGCAAMQNFTSGEIPLIRIGGALLERAVVLKWFYSLSRRKTFVGGKCTPPSALLVDADIDKACLAVLCCCR